MGLGADHVRPVESPASAERTFCPLLEDVSEPGDSETVADRRDPDLFYPAVPAGALGSLVFAAETGSPDSADPGLFRHGDLDPVFICSPIPFSFFCTVFVYPGRALSVHFCRKAQKKAG